MANTTGKSIGSEIEWICLMDYATEYGVSLSTLRRHIKAGKVEYKIENGRYLLRSASPRAATTSVSATAAAGASAYDNGEVRELKLKLQRAQEEISELKMLVAIYEEQLTPKRAAAVPSPSQNAGKRVNGY